MAEMIEYLAGTPNEPGFESPLARLRRKNFSLVTFTISERMDVFCIALVFSKGKFRNDREKIIRREKKIYDFLKRKI